MYFLHIAANSSSVIYFLGFEMIMLSLSFSVIWRRIRKHARAELCVDMTSAISFFDSWGLIAFSKRSHSPKNLSPP